jgi:Ran GTPase-activating protein (RanGAP) involved in mRNA processing and transport
MKSVRKIQLRDLRISREAVTFFEHMIHMKQLDELSLRHCQICTKSATLLRKLFTVHTRLHQVRFVDTQFLPGASSEICQGLWANKSIRQLSFINTNLDAVSAANGLSFLLQENETLQELTLSENMLGDDGVEILAQGLSRNRTLQLLDLRSNGIGKEGVKVFSQVIQKSVSLVNLSLAMNEIDDEGISILSESLTNTDTSLRELNLSETGIGEKGAMALAHMLLTNTSLCDLNLSCNSIGSFGASSIASALEHNDTLLRLSLRRNNIDGTGASVFGSKLASMRGLKELVMVNNPIDQKGSTDLLEGLRKNMEIVYLQIGDSESQHVLKEIFHWIRLNQAGRRIFRQSDLPAAIWPAMLARLTSDADVLFHFLNQKPEILET